MGYLSPIIREYLKPELGLLSGRVLDIGCGNQPYRALMSGVDSYVAMDWNIRDTLEPHQICNCFVRGSALELPFKGETFDAVVASQLLEHLAEPQNFMEEIGRVLKRGGKGILTFPLVNPVHEAPFDYTRFTEFGIRHLIEKSNLTLEKTIPMGGGWLTIGFLIYHQLCQHGDGFKSQRCKELFYRIGQMVYNTSQKIDKRWPTQGLPVNYLSVFTKDESF